MKNILLRFLSIISDIFVFLPTLCKNTIFYQVKVKPHPYQLFPTSFTRVADSHMQNKKCIIRNIWKVIKVRLILDILKSSTNMSELVLYEYLEANQVNYKTMCPNPDLYYVLLWKMTVRLDIMYPIVLLLLLSWNVQFIENLFALFNIWNIFFALTNCYLLCHRWGGGWGGGGLFVEEPKHLTPFGVIGLPSPGGIYTLYVFNPSLLNGNVSKSKGSPCNE